MDVTAAQWQIIANVITSDVQQINPTSQNSMAPFLATGPADQPPLVLVVDDDPLGREQLTIALEGTYRVGQAPTAEVALKIADQLKPDLVLLDIAMPGIGGHGFLHHWMADPGRRDIPVICISAMDTPEMEQRGLQLGAVDYVAKPYAIATVLARVRTHLELRGARLRIHRQNLRLDREHEAIEEIIERQRTASEFDPRHLRFAMSSVDKTNGDMLLAGMTPGDRQWVLVGDVAGHGLPAALCSLLVSYIFYRDIKDRNDLGATLGHINDAMCGQLPAQFFMPCCAIEIDRRQGRARVWNTGLPGCLFWPADDELKMLSPTLIPLAIEAGQDFAVGATLVSVRPGDRFYFFSDGLTELKSPSGTEFGVGGVIDFLDRQRGDFSFDTLHRRLHEFHGNGDFADDITLVEVTV